MNKKLPTKMATIAQAYNFTKLRFSATNFSRSCLSLVQ